MVFLLVVLVEDNSSAQVVWDVWYFPVRRRKKISASVGARHDTNTGIPYGSITVIRPNSGEQSRSRCRRSSARTKRSTDWVVFQSLILTLLFSFQRPSFD